MMFVRKPHQNIQYISYQRALEGFVEFHDPDIAQNYGQKHSLSGLSMTVF